MHVVQERCIGRTPISSRAVVLIVTQRRRGYAIQSGRAAVDCCVGHFRTIGVDAWLEGQLAVAFLLDSLAQLLQLAALLFLELAWYERCE